MSPGHWSSFAVRLKTPCRSVMPMAGCCRNMYSRFSGTEIGHNGERVVPDLHSTCPQLVRLRSTFSASVAVLTALWPADPEYFPYPLTTCSCHIIGSQRLGEDESAWAGRG
jgi:hypothetical protein